MKSIDIKSIPNYLKNKIKRETKVRRIRTNLINKIVNKEIEISKEVYDELIKFIEENGQIISKNTTNNENNKIEDSTNESTNESSEMIVYVYKGNNNITMEIRNPRSLYVSPIFQVFESYYKYLKYLEERKVSLEFLKPKREFEKDFIIGEVKDEDVDNILKMLRNYVKENLPKSVIVQKGKGE